VHHRGRLPGILTVPVSNIGGEACGDGCDGLIELTMDDSWQSCRGRTGVGGAIGLNDAAQIERDGRIGDPGGGDRSEQSDQMSG
jgi:hypothetical protein